MERNTVTIKSIALINHDVLEIHTQKPAYYSFSPGQATELSINKEGWEYERRPFTFTNLPSDADLQFTIKVYPDHDGVTEQLATLKKGDKLLIGEVFGAIQYKGKGIFLAGGAGVTPFISIFKSLERENKLLGNSLIFANKTKKDIFLEDTFEQYLGRKYVNILSEEHTDEYPNGRIDKAFLNEIITDRSQFFYVCGPPEMTEAVTSDLKDLGVTEDKLVIEDYG